ncbi:M20/M25/M40 family metallo-hydrolase [Enterovibrio sp. ZSDZ35]|uniref:M20/M25/M40 family metallo-hydrolase n=1 Tax=Enterovibrio qingdaonensis TaxID=2899818 RepID=A0ABT5QQW3_9GAMM|nr:M28 family peptidase [Enterovibrio sp. ZSDZ35]MDD1783362.1 M20/M25/M40 family metallo-hydrolase [Enterovibrio sp. ZSDZ35]
MNTFKLNVKKATVIAVSAVLLTGFAGCEDPRWVAKKVSKSIKEKRLVDHLEAMEGAAVATEDGNSTTRAAGTDGYANSVDYIKRKLEKHGYEVTLQPFDFRSWVELDGTTLTVNDQTLVHVRDATDDIPADYAAMSYSGSSDGALNAEIAFVTPDFDFDSADYDDTDGCTASDFDGVDVAGKVAVIQRGGCTFDAKVVNAEAAGAVGAIVFNQGNSDGRKGVVNGTLGSDSEATIPAFGARYDLGKAWYDALQGGGDSIAAALSIGVKDEVVVTQNVLAETARGNPDKIVMLGAHLDSVPEGPGINDNGSGTAGVLEYAIRLKKKLNRLPVHQKNKVRFAWWAAEEAGLVGSEYYTNEVFGAYYQDAQTQIMEELGITDPGELTAEHRELIEARYLEINPVKMYLNFDMIGSPNYIYGVMDGDLSDTKDSPDNAYPGDFEPPEGTSHIEGMFNEFFTKKNESTVPQALSKRSDYSGFADWGIAFGGLFTGAEKLKSAEEVEQFGGEVDVAYDKCYHQACDDLNNVANEALTMNSRALAYVATFYAMSDDLYADTRNETPAPEQRTLRTLSVDDGHEHEHRIGEKIKSASREVADHGHFHGDFDQDRE